MVAGTQRTEEERNRKRLRPLSGPTLHQDKPGISPGSPREASKARGLKWLRRRCGEDGAVGEVECELVCCGGEMHSRELSMGSEGKRNQTLHMVIPVGLFL